MKSLLSLTLFFVLFTLSSCSKEYTCECSALVGGVSTQSTIEATSKSKAESECKESNTELLGLVIIDCEII